MGQNYKKEYKAVAIEAALAGGEILKCELFLSTKRLVRESGEVVVRCIVEVMRVEEHSGGFGLAFRMQDYSVWKST